MKQLTFLLILIMSILFSLGCETINPLCTENYCVEGEIYAKSELPVGDEYGELPVDDAAIFATLTGTPQVESEPTVFFVGAVPPGGEIVADGTIRITFDNAPENVTVSAGTVTVAGTTAIVSGPFTPGPLALTVTWAGGRKTLNYTVLPPDTEAPTVTGSTVTDGEGDIDPEVINDDAQIVITFSEAVIGYIALTEGGDDVGWLGSIWGDKGILELVKGKEIGYSTTYVITGKVSDAAGNETEISITFVTKDEE